jgi:putative flippase GtrA
LTVIRRLLSSKVVRFLLSGGTLFVIDVTTFLICRKVLGIDVFWSEFIARTTGASVGFLLHKFFTFANPKGSTTMGAKKQGAGYLATASCNLAFSPFLVSWLVTWLHPYELMGKVLGSILLAFVTFIIYQFIFREVKTQVQQSVGES